MGNRNFSYDLSSHIMTFPNTWGLKNKKNFLQKYGPPVSGRCTPFTLQIIAPLRNIKREIIFWFVLVCLSVRRRMKLKVKKKKIKSILPITYTIDNGTHFCSIWIVRQNVVEFVLLLSKFKDVSFEKKKIDKSEERFEQCKTAIVRHFSTEQKYGTRRIVLSVFFKKSVLVSVFAVYVLKEFKNFCRILKKLCSAKFMVGKGRGWELSCLEEKW